MSHFENKQASYFENECSVYTCGINNDNPPDPTTGKRTMTHVHDLQKEPNGYHLFCQELTSGKVISHEGPAERAVLAAKLDALIAIGERYQKA